MSGRHLLLYLSTHGVCVWSWHRGRISPVEEFGRDMNERLRFAEWISSHSETLLILADLSEEEFRVETVPHLRGHDRASMISRKLEHAWRDTPFRQAVALSRNTQQDEMLLSALTNPALLMPWLEILRENQSALAGITSIAGLGQCLLPRSVLRYQLLVSWQRHGGLRLTCYVDSQPRFTRLALSDPTASFSSFISREIQQSRLYLNNLNLLPSEQVLDVYILCLPSLQTKLRGLSGEDLRYTFLSLPELAGRERLMHDFDDSDATPLWIHLLATHHHRSQYATPLETHYFDLRRLQHGLYASAALLTACWLPWSAMNLIEAKELTAESASLSASTSAISQRTRQIMQLANASGVPPTEMQNIVKLSEQLAKSTPDPRRLLQELGSILNEFPAIELQKLDWHTDDASQMPNTAPDLKIIFEGTLIPATNELTTASYIEDFRQVLESHGHAATIVRFPVRPGAISTGGYAPFTIEIGWSQTP